jgi:steroid delta-isomerase-like uncharacterized protein
MRSLEVAQQYFDGWNRRDPEAVLATMAATGTYSDPLTGGPVSGDAFAGYMKGLFSAFPDVSFELLNVGLAAPDLVSAQWIMRGTNHGSMNGLPPTGKPIELPGADFIRIANDGIGSVNGYFDSRVVPDQLGLQVLVQPTAIGPFTFGAAVRAWSGKTEKPGAFSITVLRARDLKDAAGVSELSQQIATELLAAPGFLGFVGATIGERMLTVSAWEDAEAPKQVMRGGVHAEAMKKFWSGELGGGGYTAVYVPDHVNTMWVRCPSCQKMADSETPRRTCACGATLPQAMSYW